MILFYLWILIILLKSNLLNAESTYHLTNGTHKTGYLALQTPEEAEPSCQPTSPQSLDSTYIYYADGGFEFGIKISPMPIFVGHSSTRVSGGSFNSNEFKSI